MKHYEVMVLLHPDHTDQIETMKESMKKAILDHAGSVHRFEAIGKRQLGYPIQGFQRAYYVLMNFESAAKGLEALQELFRYSETVLRHLLIRREGPITQPSALMGADEERPRSGSGGFDRRRA